MKVILDYKKLILLIRERRKAGQKISPRSICKSVGLGTHIITTINNDEDMKLSTLCRMALFLGVRLDDLVEFKEDKNLDT